MKRTAQTRSAIEADPSSDRARATNRALLRWYADHRRALPWRRSRDPYAVWISESMLQQTRVETVIPYFERFLERLPTIADLAAAEEDQVVALWSGLGYYRRARALRAAAREIVDRHDGEFPRELADCLALPGVGPYTAGAVLSIAYGLPEPLVDGNVSRVLARLFAVEEPLGRSRTTRLLWQLARELMPPPDSGLDADPGDWNQALMELGALVCTPAPRCDDCPVREHCDALRSGRVAQLPVTAPRRESVEVGLEILLARRGDRVLLVQRPEGGRMARLWELPTRERVEEGEARLWPPSHGPGLRAGADLGTLSHSITHHRIRARVRRAHASRGVDGRWVPWGELDELGLTGLTRKVLARWGRPE